MKLKKEEEGGRTGELGSEKIANSALTLGLEKIQERKIEKMKRRKMMLDFEKFINPR